MREIKFRGKRLNDGEWIYGYLADEDYINNINEIAQPSEEVARDTVGQYTGLKDGKGKEIYEGDVVNTYVCFTNEDEEVLQFWRVGEIAFANGGFALTNCTNYDNQALTIKSDMQPSKKTRNSFPAYRSEIIGNIHDNPELIPNKQ